MLNVHQGIFIGFVSITWCRSFTGRQRGSWWTASTHGFETSDIVERGRRRIRSKTVRNLLTLAHYRFKLFIRGKAAETGAIVLDGFVQKWRFAQ